jgi:hypothetical protein
MPFEVDVWQVQNIYFALLEAHYPGYAALAAKEDPHAVEWTQTFEKLGGQLAINVRRGGV